MFGEYSKERLNDDYSAYFIAKAIKLIRDNYYKEIPVKQLYYAAVKGMTDLLDEYSDYYQVDSSSIDDNHSCYDAMITSFPLREVSSKQTNEKIEQTYIIKITRIVQEVADRFKHIVDKLTASGIKYLIIDLRNNPGGYVSPCIEICSLLVGAGELFSSKDRSGKANHYYSTRQNASFGNVYVITNANTMSAGEIMACALQDRGYPVIGQPTYGKGVAQKTYTMFEGGRLRLSVEEFYRKDGGKVNKVGVQPNIICRDSDEELYNVVIKELMSLNA